LVHGRADDRADLLGRQGEELAGPARREQARETLPAEPRDVRAVGGLVERKVVAEVRDGERQEPGAEPSGDLVGRGLLHGPRLGWRIDPGPTRKMHPLIPPGNRCSRSTSSRASWPWPRSCTSAGPPSA